MIELAACRIISSGLLGKIFGRDCCGGDEESAAVDWNDRAEVSSSAVIIL